MRPGGSNPGWLTQGNVDTFVFIHIQRQAFPERRRFPQVPSNMALKFADSHNMLLFETSAKDPKESQNVDSIFMSLACRLKAQKSRLYRDVEREDGRVRLTQETEAKTNCPCWERRGQGGISGEEKRGVTYIKEEEWDMGVWRGTFLV